MTNFLSSALFAWIDVEGVFDAGLGVLLAIFS